MISPVCPHCLVALTPRPKAGVGQYYCSSCLGFVAPASSLKKFLNEAEFRHFRDDAVRAQTGVNPCTHCRRKMNVIFHLAGGRTVELDYCTNCALVWFDTGEWKDIETEASSRDRVVSRDQSLEYARLILETQNDTRKERRKVLPETVQSPSTIKTVLCLIGLPVEEESDTFANAPWVTWLLIAMCTVVSILALKSDLHVAVQQFGFFSGAGFLHRLFTSETSFFLHASVFHLISSEYFFPRRTSWASRRRCQVRAVFHTPRTLAEPPSVLSRRSSCAEKISRSDRSIFLTLADS